MYNRKQQRRGFTIVEALVGIMVLGVGVAALQQGMLTQARQSRLVADRVEARYLGLQLLEQLRTAPPEALRQWRPAPDFQKVPDNLKFQYRILRKPPAANAPDPGAEVTIEIMWDQDPGKTPDPARRIELKGALAP